MKWVVFSYSLPSKSNSSPRVALWRRLRRQGAISLTSGVYVLPARDECIEAFQWLAQEVQQANGEVLVIHVERFDGLTDSQLIELFRDVRRPEYAEIEAQAEELEKILSANTNSENREPVKDALAKLRKRYAEITRIDFFDCPESTQLASRLTQIERVLSSTNTLTEAIVPAAIAQYQDKRWVTRPRPYVDRIACAWLIRRFINPKAVIRYSLQPAPDEVAFDMQGAEFGHTGNLCSFETMVLRFGLKKPSVQTLAEIVHELDLRDGLYIHPETAGIEAAIRGWVLLGLSDAELELRGLELFDGLDAVLSKNK